MAGDSWKLTVQSHGDPKGQLKGRSKLAFKKFSLSPSPVLIPCSPHTCDMFWSHQLPGVPSLLGLYLLFVSNKHRPMEKKKMSRRGFMHMSVQWKKRRCRGGDLCTCSSQGKPRYTLFPARPPPAPSPLPPGPWPLAARLVDKGWCRGVKDVSYQASKSAWCITAIITAYDDKRARESRRRL